jgi:hypothetical protein
VNIIEKRKKQTKIIICYHCKEKIEVGLRANKYSLCKICKNKGIKITELVEIGKKIKNTILKKYGVENISMLPHIKEKKKNRNLEKYGKTTSLLNEEIKEKIKKTMLIKYGVENPSQSNKIKEKIKQTNLEKYGVEHNLQSEKIKEKIKKTMLIKYGVENPSQSNKIKEKIKQTNLEKYGNNCSIHCNNIELKSKITKLNNMNEKINLSLKELNLELIDKYNLKNREKIKFKCLKCNNIFETCWFNIQQWYKCPGCFPKIFGISKMEKEIVEYIKTLGIENEDIIENSRQIISPKELDIFIPSKNIAIEFHGLFWHCDKYVDKNYHRQKYEDCQNKNIRIIQIFEDEWLFKSDIVKARLKQILGVFNGQRIHARKCLIREIDYKTKNEFLENYHIQGKDGSQIRLGAFYNNELVSIMTFSVSNISKGAKKYKGKKHVWELNRFCIKHGYHIPGMASKFLKHFKNIYKWQIIFSYADLRWSEGNVYYKLGFILDSKTQPNYFYFKENKIRKHRFGLRKRPDEPKNRTEMEIRNEEGFFRIYDCGNLKFVMENKEYKYIDILYF